MASQFIGLNRGQTLKDVVTGTSTQSTDFELRIDTGKSSTKLDTQLAMDILHQYIISNGLPDGQTGVNLPPN
jgi:hypothetical protein